MTRNPQPEALADIHRRIAARLAELADAPTDVPPHPYIRRHLAQHADLGGVLDDAHLPARFLPWDTDGHLRGRLGLPVTPSPGFETLAAWASIEPFVQDADHQTRTASLQFALATAGVETGDTAIVWPRFSRWYTTNNVIVETAVFRLAAFASPDGRPLLATGGRYGMVRVLDPLTGVPVGEPLRGHEGPVRAMVAFDDPDGRPLLATGGDDGSVWVWDPLTGVPVGEPLRGREGPVRAMVAFTDSEGPLLATNDDRGVLVQDPLAGGQVRVLRVPDPVLSVAAFDGSDGRPLLATGGRFGMVRVLDPLARTVVGRLRGQEGPVLSVAAFAGSDGRPLLATGGDDRAVRVWDPLAGDQVPVLQGHAGWLTAVAAFAGPDGQLLATAGLDGPVEVWDPLAGVQLGEPLGRYGHPVLSVAAFDGLDGRPLLATGGLDGAVEVWDLLAGVPVGEPLRGHEGPVGAMAAFVGLDGRPLLATAAGLDGAVEVWDPLAGVPVGEPLRGHAGPVGAMVTFPGADGEPMVATGGDDGSVRVWDPLAGVPVGEPLRGHAGPVGAMVTFPGADGQPMLATGGGRTVCVWALATKRCFLRIVTISYVHALASMEGLRPNHVGLSVGAGAGVVLVDVDLR